MKLDCKQISISDDDLGCQVTFSEKIDLGEKTENMSVKEIIDSIRRYLLLQRTYSEIDYGKDNYYFETQDEILSGELKAFEIVMSRQTFELQFDSETIEISINPTDKEYSDLMHVIPIIIDKKGRLTING